MELVALLMAVNATVNANMTYISDMEAHGVSQYTELQETGKWCPKQGDCEEFALCKMQTLMQAGVNEYTMELGFYRIPGGQAHAVLHVMHNGDLYILDNRTDEVIKVK